MDNENKNVVNDVEMDDSEKAMQSFLTGANDYEAEKTEGSAGIKLGRFETLICALAVFAYCFAMLRFPLHECIQKYSVLCGKTAEKHGN